MKKFADWRKRSQVNNADFNKLYQERNEFMKEDSTGFVWLYLQK